MVVNRPRRTRLSVTIYRAPNRGADQAIDRDWLQGYALVTETRTIAMPAGPRDDPLRRRRRRHAAGERDRHRPARKGCARRISMPICSRRAACIARSFGRPVTIRRTDRQRQDRRGARDHPFRRRWRGDPADHGWRRGGQLCPAARLARLSRGARGAFRPGRHCRSRPTRRAPAQVTVTLVLSGLGLRLAGQLCRDACADDGSTPICSPG